jgi:hypothetical protein
MSTIPLKLEDFQQLADSNNILFDRLPITDDVGSLLYTCDDIRLEANELLNKDNINNCFEKIYSNLTYILSRSFTINNNIPKSFLGLQPIDDNRFGNATGITVFESDNDIDVIGFVSSSNSIGILSGYYIDYGCDNINGGCFTLDGVELTIPALTALAKTHNKSTVLHVNSTGEFAGDVIGAYDGSGLQPDICGSCVDEIVFKALVIGEDSTQSNVMSNTDDFKFSNISTIASDSSTNLLFVLDTVMTTIYIYDTTGYLNDDDIYIKRVPAGRILVDQIGGVEDTILDDPKSIAVEDGKLYVFESGSETKSCTVKIFNTSTLALVDTIALDDTVNDSMVSGFAGINMLYSIIKLSTSNSYKINTYNLTTGETSNFTTPYIRGEIPLQFQIGISNPNIAYLLTTKNIYKFHITKLYIPTGKFDFSSVPKSSLDGDDIFNCFYIKEYYGEPDTDELFVTVKNKSTLLRFIDSNNYIKILHDNFEDNMYGFSSVKIGQDEYVNAFTYNNAIRKTLSDHITVINNIRGKFVSDEAVSDQYGFNYISTQETLGKAGILDTINDIKLNTRIGSNEFILTSVVNRCIDNICKMQTTLLKLVEFDPDTDLENIYVEFDRKNITKKNRDLPIEKPIITEPEPSPEPEPTPGVTPVPDYDELIEGVDNIKFSRLLIWWDFCDLPYKNILTPIGENWPEPNPFMEFYGSTAVKDHYRPNYKSFAAANPDMAWTYLTPKQLQDQRGIKSRPSTLHPLEYFSLASTFTNDHHMKYSDFWMVEDRVEFDIDSNISYYIAEFVEGDDLQIASNFKTFLKSRIMPDDLPSNLWFVDGPVTTKNKTTKCTLTKDINTLKLSNEPIFDVDGSAKLRTHHYSDVSVHVVSRTSYNSAWTTAETTPYISNGDQRPDESSLFLFLSFPFVSLKGDHDKNENWLAEKILHDPELPEADIFIEHFRAEPDGSLDGDTRVATHLSDIFKTSIDDVSIHHNYGKDDRTAEQQLIYNRLLYGPDFTDIYDQNEGDTLGQIGARNNWTGQPYNLDPTKMGEHPLGTDGRYPKSNTTYCYNNNWDDDGDTIDVNCRIAQFSWMALWGFIPQISKDKATALRFVDHLGIIGSHAGPFEYEVTYK